MSSFYYSAAWTECGCLFTCWHQHPSVSEAAGCVRGAGDYVVATDSRVMRSLTPAEEVEFQCAVRTCNLEIVSVEDEPVEADISDPRYAVMTRFTVGDQRIWTTWMCWETRAEAIAHARPGDRVVRFRSPEWLVLRHQKEAAHTFVGSTEPASFPPSTERESLVEFVLRFLSAHDYDRVSKEGSDAGHSSIDPARGRPIKTQEDEGRVLESYDQQSALEIVDWLWFNQEEVSVIFHKFRREGRQGTALLFVTSVIE